MSQMTQSDMVTSPAGVAPKSDSTGTAQYQLYRSITDPTSREEKRSTRRKSQMTENIFTEVKKKWSRFSDCGLITG
jgi:hypothetical protein